MDPVRCEARKLTLRVCLHPLTSPLGQWQRWNCLTDATENSIGIGPPTSKVAEVKLGWPPARSCFRQATSDRRHGKPGNLATWLRPKTMVWPRKRWPLARVTVARWLTGATCHTTGERVHYRSGTFPIFLALALAWPNGEPCFSPIRSQLSRVDLLSQLALHIVEAQSKASRRRRRHLCRSKSERFY